MDSPAPDYDRIWRDVYGDMQDVGPVHRHMRRLVTGLLRPLSYASALEVGCGSGHNFSLLARGRSLSRLTGADVSAEALRRARQRAPHAELARLDITRESLPDTWDLVFCSLLLEHVEDDLSAIGNMREMSRSYLLLTTIAGDYERYRPWEEQMGHVRNYAPGELESKLVRSGFKIRRTIYWGWPFYSPLARRLQNHLRSEPSYGYTARFLTALMHKLYFLNSARRGDLLIVLADVV